MFYVKNVPSWERAARTLAGLAMIAGGLLSLRGSLAGYALLATGIISILTGIFGFCPMCALAGRRLDSDS